MGTNTLPAAGVRTRRRSAGSMQRQQRIFVLVALVPMAIIFLVFWIYPMLDGLWGSFTNWSAFNPQRSWVGLKHYNALFADDIFLHALQNTFVFALVYVPASILLALLVAVAIEGTGALRPIFRTIYFLPVVTSVIATGLIWAWLYQPALGLFNQLLQLAGLPTQRFLLSPQQALMCIVVYSLWKNLGFNMVLFMAGLSGIDPSFAEAARVDGANRWQVFTRITLPLLRPTVVFVLITGVIEALQIFGPIFVMTSQEANAAPGGPLNSTMVVAVYQWQVGFRELNLGYAAAMGIVLFLIILVLTLLQTPLLRQRWEY
jgi:ABC-type sugar transport system permease subunit